MRLIIVLSSLALVVSAGAQATPQRGTLTGIVMRGPITPVCVAEQPCSAPARGVTLVFTRNGAVVGRAVTTDTGRYRLRLPSGRYSVRRATVAPSAVDRNLEP